MSSFALSLLPFLALHSHVSSTSDVSSLTSFVVASGHDDDHDDDDAMSKAKNTGVR